MAIIMPMTPTVHKRYSIAEARNQLPAVVHEVERGDPVEITRHGKPVAVVLSYADYARLRSPKPDLWEAYQRWRAESEGILTDEDVDMLADPSRNQEPSERIVG